MRSTVPSQQHMNLSDVLWQPPLHKRNCHIQEHYDINMQFIWECCSFKAYQSQRRYKVVSWKISESWRTYSISVSYYILSQNETKKCLKEIRVSWLSHSNHQPFQWWDVRKIHCYVCCWSLESQYLTDKDQENASLTLGDWLQKTNGYFRIETWNWQETFCFAKQLHRLFSTNTCWSCTQVVSSSFI